MEIYVVRAGDSVDSIAQELGVETGIQEVKHRMLHAADIHVYRKQGVRLLSGYQFLVIVIIHIAQEIPG